MIILQQVHREQIIPAKVQTIILHYPLKFEFLRPQTIILL